MKQKILIIGGGGFIGMHLGKFLIKNRNCDLTLADYSFSRNKSDYFSEEELDKITFLTNNFAEFSAYDDLDTDFDNVYMLASVVGVNEVIENPQMVLDVNTSLIFNCLNWLKTTDIKKVLFTSTSEAYSGAFKNTDYPIPTDELVPLVVNDIHDPRFTYAITKILGESAFLHYSTKYNFEATIVRYHNTIGPDMGFKHVVPHLVERFMNGESPFKMYGYDQTRTFSYVEDSVEGTVLAMESDNTNGEIFHLGSTEEISIETLIKQAGKVMKYEGEYTQEPTFPGSVARRCPDISKAKRILDFNPKVDWKTGLHKTIEWYKNYFENYNIAGSEGFKRPDELKILSKKS